MWGGSGLSKATYLIGDKNGNLLPGHVQLQDTHSCSKFPRVLSSSPHLPSSHAKSVSMKGSIRPYLDSGRGAPMAHIWLWN